MTISRKVGIFGDKKKRFFVFSLFSLSSPSQSVWINCCCHFSNSPFPIVVSSLSYHTVWDPWVCSCCNLEFAAFSIAILLSFHLCAIATRPTNPFFNMTYQHAKSALALNSILQDHSTRVIKTTIPVEIHTVMVTGTGAAESPETSVGVLRWRTSTSSLRCIT